MNNNAKFTGFSPEELAAAAYEPEPTLELVEEVKKIICDPAPNYYDYTSTVEWTPSAETLQATQQAQQAQANAGALTLADVKKAKEQLTGTSIKTKEGYYYGYSTAPTTATMTSTPYSTYIIGKDAFYGYGVSLSDPQLDAWMKEITRLEQQLAEAKEIIKQLSGEPGEFIYIHPFDLYELLNSFVIPVSLNVDQDMKDIGHIEINGKKYKQSTSIPAKSEKAKEHFKPKFEYSSVKDLPW
jgi:hypothetical protein